MTLTLIELDSGTFVISDHIKLARLALHFIFASEHHVIRIKQRPSDRLLKISCDGIREDNKKECRKRRAVVYLVRDGNSIEVPVAA
ncbi:unnamed protein product [Heligmosomoides polygyrus]|uniref:Subtype I-C CRISPR-associated endonuclease Cas1 n=1 Tax=Heligmosomoides polygyrus TaxID=6339 RepID=A0A183G5A0_HELPZ|nr:unnamed protein product [Heligmosomoides polygyrus]